MTSSPPLPSLSHHSSIFLIPYYIRHVILLHYYLVLKCSYPERPKLHIPPSNLSPPHCPAIFYPSTKTTTKHLRLISTAPFNPQLHCSIINLVEHQPKYFNSYMVSSTFLSLLYSPLVCLYPSKPPKVFFFSLSLYSEHHAPFPKP